MDRTADVVSIEELRGRRAARDASRAVPPPPIARVPVRLAWVPVRHPSSSGVPSPLRAAGWSGR